jgi:RNA-directed DNA polymerase
MSGLLATYGWGQLSGRKLEVAVFKLQKRIYKASQAGDVRRVHRLQRLLLKSRAAKLLAVRRVTQDNRGKHTAGVDGIKSLTPAHCQLFFNMDDNYFLTLSQATFFILTA